MKIENAHYVFEVSPDNGALVRLRDKLGGIELLTHGRLAESFRLLLPLPEACRPTTFSGPSSNCRRRT